MPPTRPQGAPKAPTLPFDAFRVHGHPETDFLPGIIVTRVQVLEYYPHSKMALVRYGRRGHSEMACPFSELHSTAKAALSAVEAKIPHLRPAVRAR